MEKSYEKLKEQIDGMIFEQLKDSLNISQASTTQLSESIDFDKLHQINQMFLEKPRYAYILSNHISKTEIFVSNEDLMPFERNGVKYKIVFINPACTDVIKKLIEIGVKSAEEIGLI